ncbi:MAG: hypothetical protein R3C49_15310 [Planctomycetaceae bacterium]
MQASFWKTIAAVAVIGMGSLAILEVQHRLPKRGATTAESAASDQVASSGDQTIDAMLSEGEFDRLMQGEVAAAEQKTFAELREPDPSFGDETAHALLTAAAPSAAPLKPTPQAPALNHEADIANSDPIPAQDHMPPVNTAVHAADLEQGGNPFADTGKAVAATYQANEQDDKQVHPTGFEDTRTPQSDPAFEAKTPTQSPFALLGAEPDSKADAKAAPSEPVAAAQPQQLKAVASQLTASANAKNPVNGLAFFGGEEQASTSEVRTAAAVPAASPKKTTQFYGSSGEAFGSSQPAFPEGSAADVHPAADSQPDAVSGQPFEAEGAGESPFRPFEEDNAAQPKPAQPAWPGSGSSDGTPIPFPGDSDRPPFGQLTEDSVPVPRDAGTTPQPLPFDGNGARFEDVPATETPGDDLMEQTIPFVEDTSEPDFPTDSSRPADSGLSIPGMSDRSWPAIEPNPVPIETPRTTPPSSGVREFGSSSPASDFPALDFDARPNTPSTPGSRPSQNPDFGSFNNNSSPNRTQYQDSPIEIHPRGSEGANGLNSRTFEPERQPGGTFPGRGLDNGDFSPPSTRTESGIRQVSGTMRPNLVLQKTAPENATVGAPLNYKIFVRNEGDATAYDVVVEDEVTAAARVEGTRPQSDLDRATNRLSWKFASIEPGDTQEIEVRVVPTGEGVMDGVATVKFKSRVKATTVVTAPNLKLQMEGPREVRLGEEVAYRYILRNEGTGEARDVFVRTLLPANGGLRHPQGRDLEYEIRSMKPGEQREIVLAVVAGEPGEHRAEAEVTTAGGVADQAAWRTNVVGAQLQIVRRGPKQRFVGKAASYENIIVNETNFPAMDAKVVEKIPEGMRFVSATRGGQYNESTRTVTWTINQLAARAQEQLQVELMPTRSGELESIVTIYENIGVQSEDYVSTTVVEDLHNVSATISQLDGPVAQGETFGFTISIDNRGTADATDIELEVDVPEGIAVVGAGSKDLPAKLLGGNRVQYTVVGRIEPDRRQTFELKLRGERAMMNELIKARVHYKQMSEPLIVSEAVTIYQEQL